MFEKESKSAKNELRKVLKSYQKKTFKKTRKVDPNRQPTGFAKPSLISEELCKFLNKASGTKMLLVLMLQRKLINISRSIIFKIQKIRKKLN